MKVCRTYPAATGLPWKSGLMAFFRTLVDAVKLLGKEMVTPGMTDKVLFFLAPIPVVAPAFVGFVPLPFGPTAQIRDVNVGILLIFSFSSISVISILMAGWSSNNKYSLIGAVRSVAQNVAYEIPLLLSTMSVIIMTNTFKMGGHCKRPVFILVYSGSARRRHYFFHCHHRRNQPGPFRSGRGRIGTRFRFSYRIHRDEIFPVFLGRIHEYGSFPLPWLRFCF